MGIECYRIVTFLLFMRYKRTANRGYSIVGNDLNHYNKFLKITNKLKTCDFVVKLLL